MATDSYTTCPNCDYKKMLVGPAEEFNAEWPVSDLTLFCPQCFYVEEPTQDDAQRWHAEVIGDF